MKLLFALAGVSLFATSNVEAIRIRGDDKEEEDHSGEFFTAEEDGVGPVDKKYERTIPDRFTDEGDDIFMKSMIKTYALESKNKDGSPTGRFWMNKEKARAASSEVLDNNKGLKHEETESWLGKYFEKTWAHFDVNESGKVEVEVMPQFMRFLASDQQLKLF